jgi:hypothetical protein
MAAPRLFSTDLDLILRETQALWEPMRGQRIFITGGTGFLAAGWWRASAISTVSLVWTRTRLF